VNATINHDADSARLAIAEQLAVVNALLRLLDPGSPFQPILVGSIDLAGWQALFGQAATAIETLLPQAIGSLPTHARKRITAVAAPLFSLAHSICDAPQIHMSEHATELHDQGLLPDLVDLDSDPIRSPEEEKLVEEARGESGEFLEQSATQFALLRRQLTTSAEHLTNTLTQKHGLHWLLRRGLKKSKRFGEKFQSLADELESVLASPPPAPDTPWSDARRWFARLAATFEVHVLPEIDAVLKDAIPRTAGAGRAPEASAPPSRQSIKNSCLRSWDSFLQAYTATSNIAAAQHAYSLWKLFAKLTETLSSSLIEESLLPRSVANSDGDGRIVEGLARLDHRVIARSVLAQWDRILVAEDDYVLQIILAGIHHLERPNKDDENTAGRRRTVVYAFSEETMARWLSRGEYPGVNPDREASGKVETETRRTRRALEHLRRNQAALHGRRHWSPLPSKITEAASNRFWTINPLLAAHPQIKALIARTPVPAAAANTTRETRQRPSRRNRGIRRKS